MAILDQHGRPYDKRQRPVGRRLAAAPLYNSGRDYVATGLTPGGLAAIFREADAGDMRRQAELFETLTEKDAHLLGEITKRRHAVMDVDFSVTPVSDSARDVDISEFVQGYFDRRTDFTDDLLALQYAVGNGYSSMEIVWDVSTGQAIPADLAYIEPERLIFTDAAGRLQRHPRLITDDNLMGVEIPPWKTLLHTYGGKSGHPTRTGVYRVAAWMYLFKNYSIKDWLIFCEVYGMPVRLGKYEPGASPDDKEALEAAIRAIGTDAAGIISTNTDIDFLDKQGTRPAAELYRNLADWCNREVSKAIVGQTLSAEAGDVGSYSLGKVHNEVRIDLAKADTRALGETIRSQLIRPMVGFNFGWDAPVPHFGPVWEDEEDLEKKSKWVESFTRLAPVPSAWLYKEFGVPQPEKGEDTIGGPAPGGTPAPAKKARISAKQAALRAKDGGGDGGPANGPAAAVDALVTMFEREIDDLPGDIIAAVRGVVDQADDLETAYTALADLAAENAIENAAGKLQKAMAAAELAGRMGVMDEIEGADDD